MVAVSDIGGSGDSDHYSHYIPHRQVYGKPHAPYIPSQFSLSLYIQVMQLVAVSELLLRVPLSSLCGVECLAPCRLANGLIVVQNSVIHQVALVENVIL